MKKSELFSISDQMLRQDEIVVITDYLDWLGAKYPGALIQANSATLIETIRHQDNNPNPVELMMSEYNMSRDEGLLLMSLSEALLRTKHGGTRNGLVADKLSQGQWSKRSKLFKTWTAFLLEKSLLCSKWLLSSTGPWLGSMSAMGIRVSMQIIMRALSDQFVFSDTIKNAMKRSEAGISKGYQYSFDLLGEASLTMKDADAFIASYHQALDQLLELEPSKRSKMAISIKLSAFCPRFESLLHDMAEEQLVDTLVPLIEKAKEIQVPITIDAEEVNRLNMITRVMQRLIMHPVTDHYDGLGCAVQAYTKVAPYVIEQLADCARSHGRKINIRLIKGAYWDTEIKEAQVEGYHDYPVFTRKEFTDVSFLRCVYILQEHSDVVYAQFGTHNANTVAAVQVIMGFSTPYEFQCLHGMGQALYHHLMVAHPGAISCRIYAPVGDYQELLPYLVRRLLENGANSSFVHHLHDTRISAETMAKDVTVLARSLLDQQGMMKPSAMFKDRRNSFAIDWSDTAQIKRMSQSIETQKQEWMASSGGDYTIFSPNTGLNISSMSRHSEKDLQNMIGRSELACSFWRGLDVSERAACLEKAADTMEIDVMTWAAKLVIEAGKTWQDAIGEVRETVDFLRYYAVEARCNLVDKVLPGPTGESNILQYHGRGVWFCISPWNFPLAIFTGQVVAALVAGNAVIAKGASQTSLISRDMIELLHQSGIPKDVLQGVFAGASVAKALFSASEISGVVMTGGNESALWMRRALANREGPMLPFIAETGGQNILISDPSAHPDQLLRDVVMSAFRSAGQRCSALRVWYCHDSVYDDLTSRLSDMMDLLQVGSPEKPETDVGPVINKSSRDQLLEHVAWCDTHARLIGRTPMSENVGDAYFAPVAYEIDNISQLDQEWFGPILHVIRYRDKDLLKVLQDIRATGYGLTMGIHSRVDSFVDTVISHSNVGNTYVNRNMIGATVGVQPFGGEGLSGTGPKAGGPNYLMRFVSERVISINTAAVGGNASLLNGE